VERDLRGLGEKKREMETGKKIRTADLSTHHQSTLERGGILKKTEARDREEKGNGKVLGEQALVQATTGGLQGHGVESGYDH